MFSMSHIGLATAMGHSLDIPPITRSLARHYEDTAVANTDFVLDEKLLQFLISGNFDVPDTHIRQFAQDWWNELNESSLILSPKTSRECVRFHIKEHQRVMEEAKNGKGPAVVPAPPDLYKVDKPSYSWHGKTWDEPSADHCIYCRSYRAVCLGTGDQIRDLRNLVNAMETAHQSERTLAMRDCAALNCIYERVVFEETAAGLSKEAATSKSGKKSGKKAAKAKVATAEAATAEAAMAKNEKVTQYDPSSKWTWGVKLTEGHIKSMVRAADNNFKLPHSGYDESLDDGSMPSESAGPTRSEHERLEDEAKNPPLYEKMSSDVWEERDLEPHEFPKAFECYPLLRGSSRKYHLRNNVGTGVCEVYPPPWNDPPPDDYVQRPRPPLESMIPFPFYDMGDDLNTPIFIGSDIESDGSKGEGPSGAIIDPYVLGDSLSIYLESDDEENIDDTSAAAVPNTETDNFSAAAMPIDVYVESDGSIHNFLDDIFIPADDSGNDRSLEIYIPDEDEIDGPSGRHNSGPYTAADFVNFDINLLE